MDLWNFTNIFDLDQALDKIRFDECYYFELTEVIALFQDPISEAVSKYDLAETKFISENEATVLLESREKIHSRFLVSLVEIYLLFGKETYKLSQAEDAIRSLWIEEINLEKNHDSLIRALRNFFFLLSPLLYKKPCFKCEAQNMIYGILSDKRLSAIERANIIYLICSEKLLIGLLSSEQWESIFSLLSEGENTIGINEAVCYYRYLHVFLKAFIPGKIVKKEIITAQICNLVLRNIEAFSPEFLHANLQEIRAYMDELRTFSDQDYMRVDSCIAVANSTIKASLKEYEMQIKEPCLSQFLKCIDSNYKCFSKLPMQERIQRLFSSLDPLDVDQLKKEIKNSKGLFSQFVEVQHLRPDGSVINSGETEQDEMFSLEAKPFIDLTVKLVLDGLYTPFIKSGFVADADAEKLVISSLNESVFIQKDDVEFMKDIILKCIGESDYLSFITLILSFEQILRKYFNSKGINVLKMDGSGEYIDLNYIFNSKETNQFKNCLLETIDDNYYFTFRWLLTDKNGLNLRNKIAHGLKDQRSRISYLETYAALQIIRLFL